MKRMRIASQGFTITELAVVLVIVALLIGGMLVPLSAQYELANIAKTRDTLNNAQEALLGFAVANSRLPCPAAPGTTGVESPGGGGTCTNPLDGYFPAAALGITPVDSQGYLIDAWGGRIRYAVTSVGASAFTSTNGIKSSGIGTLDPDFYVCASATGTTGSSCGTATPLASKVPALIFSLGSNGANTGGIDEAKNIAGGKVFVFHEPTPASAANGSFDDLLLWLSQNTLYNRMVSAGKLP